MNAATKPFDWQTILKAEYEAQENTFVFQLRCGRGWDKAAYYRLFRAMLECCKAHDGRPQVERWIADLFWWLDSYPRHLVGNGKLNEDDYYQNAVVNFNHLTHWLFSGQRRPDDQFEPL